MTKNKFHIIFSQDENEIDCEYTLADSIIAKKWFEKIKHLKNINVDPVESRFTDVSDLSKIYNNFCEKYKITPTNFVDINEQKNLNILHKIYEEWHDKLTGKDKEDLYEFHHAIHNAENNKNIKNKVIIGWGTKEGPLTEQFDCNPYYENEIIKNNMYLPWTELGKKPFDYWSDGEPNNEERVMELCKAHFTFRAQFFIALKSNKPKSFPQEFIDWFSLYKTKWLQKNNIEKWNEVNEFSAPLLAYGNHDYDLTGAKIIKILTSNT